MSLDHQQKTETKLPNNLGHVVLSLLIGYFTASVLTSRNLTNWATQLPVNNPNQELERILQKHAKRSAKLGGDAVTQKLESNFTQLHDMATKPLSSEPLPPNNRTKTGTLTQAPQSQPQRLRPRDITTTPLVAASKIKAANDRALLIGDSLMAGIGPFLSYVLQTKKHLKPQLVAKIGTGLARPDRFDWTRVLREDLKSQRFRIMVILLGTNDTQNIKVGKKGFLFGGPTWQRIYTERLEELMTTACRKSEVVYWLGLPTMRDPEFSRKASHLNAVIKSAAVSHSCIRYIDLQEPRTDTAYTAYASLGLRQIKVRAPDGIHFTTEGAKLLSASLLEKIQYSQFTSTKDTVTASIRHPQATSEIR